MYLFCHWLHSYFKVLHRNISFAEIHLITALLFYISKRVVNVHNIYLYLLWFVFFKSLKDAGVLYDTKLLLNAISYIFRSAAKAKLPTEKLIAELKSSLCWKENTLSVLKHVWNEQGKILSSSDLTETLNVGQLLDMKWKLSVGVSSSSCRSLNSPYITVLVTVTDPSGGVSSKSFEMAIGEFKKFASQMREIASVLETV